MNKVELQGTLTKDVALSMTKSNKCYARFSLVVKGEGKEGTNFISCVAWEEIANKLSDKKKDDTLHIKGFIKTGSYEKNGQKVYTTDVVVKEIITGVKPETAKIEIKDDDLPFF